MFNDNNPKVGDLVYPCFKPRMVGKVTKVLTESPSSIFPCVTIKWIDRTEVTMITAGLRCFLSLIEDHRKKLRTHEMTLQKAQLIGE